MEYRQYKKGNVTKTFKVDGGKILSTIKIGEHWVSNPTIAMMTADGWQDVTPAPHVRTLAEAIAEKVSEISSYDSSTEVNQFYLNGIGMWYDYTGRCKINDRIARDKAKGLTTTTLGDDGYVIQLPIATAESMMAQLEEYATACYDKTNEHKAAVRSLTSIDEVDVYDYKVGYPEKLNFNLNGDE